VGYPVPTVRVLISVATDLEGAVLRARLAPSDEAEVVATGVGPVNAAHAVTLAILRQRPQAIIVCGVGGAYPGSGLAVGEVACADVECYGDLGADGPSGFIDMRALGFPLIPGDPPLYNELPLQVFPHEHRVKFVTVSTCTGTDAAARALAARTGGAVENMEGAAVAHVAHLHGIPVGEVRGISNLVTTRDPGAWRLKEAALAAQEALVRWMARR
jgi:futalosine hydrolase